MTRLLPVRRVAAGAAAVVTIAAGLAVHRWAFDTPVSDAAGDVLYAVLIHLLVVALRPRWRVWGCALIALAWCTAVEAFQLTGLPEIWGTVSPAFMLVFGTVFSPTDLVMYAAGIAIAASLDVGISTLAGGVARRRISPEDSS